MDDSNDDFMHDVEETQETQTQQQTQSTQPASQQTVEDMNGHLWGYLQPCAAGLARIDFWKMTPKYRLGRNQQQNDCVLPGGKIMTIADLEAGNQHCTITWDGSYETMNIIVQDNSSNGTFINGVKIGRGLTRVLREGDEIAFGSPVPQAGSLEDYRFIYRHTASGPPTTGLYAFYDLINELGKGSFAVVMKAVSRNSGEFVAVKMIHDTRNVRSPGEQNAQPRREAFNREINIMSKLKHPNICELKEVFFPEGTNDLNLVLELVEGGDLLEYIVKREGLQEPEAQHITYQICDALAYVHSQNVAHRDLKPENILLTKDDPPRVKVADFGLAKLVDNMTMLRTMCGTPSYLAPEVVLQHNNQGYSNVVDSWSTGVIVFSMLTYSSPFVEEDNRDVRTRVAERTIEWSLLTAVRASANATDFIRRLLEEDPRQRMTLTAALQHPWLKSYVPVYGLATHHATNTLPSDEYSMMANGTDSQSSFRGSVNAEFQNLHIQSSVGTAADGLGRQPSRVAPLQRRSLIALHAQENGGLPDPPAEMIANAAAQQFRDEQEEDGPSSSNPKGANKRVYSELTPLPEEASMASAGDKSSVVVVADEKMDEESTPAPPKKTRGKGKASCSPSKASARIAGKGADNRDAAATPPTRRSTRPQKQVRRA
ncbi:hypothetical protein H0H92_001890 [Tricholoma furcatifolium]|nr:hypothetical protein H0H92_001890 [Tricholoma furcatifolium]